MKNNSKYLKAIRSHLIFLIAISIIAILFAFKQIKFWRTVILLVCLIGILNGETVAVFQVWFRGIDSFEALVSRWDLHSNYPRLVAAGFRNGILIPLLYAAVIVLTIKDWNHFRHARRDI